MLARGDRRDFVAIDPEGGVHALGKRLLGCPMAEIRVRLADLEDLPCIAEACESLGQHIFQRHPPASPLEVPEHVPTENLGPVPGADRFNPNVREPQVLGEKPGVPVIGAAVAGMVSAIAHAAASGAEKGFALVANVYSFGAAGSSTPTPAPVEPAVPEKPRHDPHEDAAHMLHTADRGIAQDDPAMLAAFATNPSAAAPDLAQQLRDRWRTERERDRDIER